MREGEDEGEEEKWHSREDFSHSEPEETRRYTAKDHMPAPIPCFFHFPRWLTSESTCHEKRSDN